MVRSQPRSAAIPVMVSRVAAEVAWIRLYEKGLLSIAGYDGLASFSWTG